MLNADFEICPGSRKVQEKIASPRASIECDFVGKQESATLSILTQDRTRVCSVVLHGVYVMIRRRMISLAAIPKKVQACQDIKYL